MDNSWNTRGTIKMGGHIIWITFVITAQLSAVLGRNSYYEYYYSRYHHKGHSTTAGLSSSTTGISADISDVSSEERTASSVSGDTPLENILHSLTVDLGTTVHRNTTLQGYGDAFDDSGIYDHDFAMNVALIVGLSFGVLMICTCLCFCLLACRRRNTARPGYIISNNAQGIVNEAGPQQYQQPVTAQQYRPQQHAVPQQYQQPVTAQQYPPQHLEERQQLFPPQPGQEQYPLMQQQHPNSPMLHNPPEAPPPYEFPEKF